MKICFFNTTLAWGGGERWHLDMATHLKDPCTDVIIVAHPQGELFKKAQTNNIPLFGFKLKNLSFLRPCKIFRLERFFKNEKPDVVILNLPRDLKAAGIAAKRAGIKKIIYRRGSAIPIKNSFINQYLFKHIITGIIANSFETKITILQRNPQLFDKSKIQVIYNGIDLNKLDATGVLHEKNKDNTTLIIGNLGRMVKQKGQEDFIYLAKKLLKKKINFSIQIGGDGPRMEEIKSLAKKEGVNEYITFSGFIHDVKGFMQNIDVFVLPSRWEGFGYVLVEAMAMGKPVIAYDVSSNPEIINHNHTGWLVPQGNLDAMAEHLEKLYSNPDELEKMAPICKQWVAENFTLEKAIKTINKYLTEP